MQVPSLEHIAVIEKGTIQVISYQFAYDSEFEWKCIHRAQYAENRPALILLVVSFSSIPSAVQSD